MTEYYKLSLLKRKNKGVVFENIYFEISNGRSSIIKHEPLDKKLICSNLEKISEEEAIESL